MGNFVIISHFHWRISLLHNSYITNPQYFIIQAPFVTFYNVATVVAIVSRPLFLLL
jgi:hypothetical protein